ncbi:hypothetical protein GCM10011444_06090 [Winogradskyella haliclonae]|uniref:Uncharacterized protein n=1 Tax=Winogradskyella haliclonae TaxID=2048558 RepID=A0ABQ2BWT5_9FLAO|nr:hypothetical protein GCM10011444_06090 [Winogradskyella haliclonae]
MALLFKNPIDQYGNPKVLKSIKYDAKETIIATSKKISAGLNNQEYLPLM